MRISLALLVAALLLGAGAAAQCSGHGTLEDGKCRCDNPWPEEGGQSGWTGPECSIPVHSTGKADGADMAAACGNCSRLEPGDWACFAVRAPFNDTSFSYMTVLLNRTSTDEKGDPDLFGEAAVSAPACWSPAAALMVPPPALMLAALMVAPLPLWWPPSLTSLPAPSFCSVTPLNTRTLAGMWTGGSGGLAVPNKTARGYDWQDTSSSSHATIVKMLKKADYGLEHDYEGAYTCVRAYGSQPITFALHALLTPCPASFDAAGAPLMCQSALGKPEEERRYSECSAAGECVCTGQYAKPLQSVFPGGWVGGCGGGGGGLPLRVVPAVPLWSTSAAPS